MNTIRQKFDVLMRAYEDFKNEVRQQNRQLFERWKAGGYLIDTNIASMYPNAEEVCDSLSQEDDEDDEDDEEDEDEDEDDEDFIYLIEPRK